MALVDIPLLQTLIASGQERRTDGSAAENRPDRRVVLRGHLCYFDSSVISLQTAPKAHPLHPRFRGPSRRCLGRDPGGRPRDFRHRHGGRAVSDPQAPKPEHQPRLCRESHARVNHHHRRHNQRPVGRNPAARRWGSGRSEMPPHSSSSNGRWLPSMTGLPARPRLLCRLRKRVLLGYLMYKSGLVPRGMAMLGLIGGPLILASGIAIVFGGFKNGSPAASLAGPSGNRLGSVARRLPHRQGVQAFPGPRCPATQHHGVNRPSACPPSRISGTMLLRLDGPGVEPHPRAGG